MERFHTQRKYNKDEEFQKSRPRQRVRTEDGGWQGRRPRKQYSNGYKEYFRDENESMVMKNSSNQVEKKSMKSSSQAFVKESKKHVVNNAKKHNSSVNFQDEFPPLNAIDINSELSENRCSSNNNKINVDDFPPLNQCTSNAHSESKKQNTKNSVSNKYSTRINFKDEFPSSNGVNVNTELSETKSSNKINVNKGFPVNQDINNTHSEAHLSRSQNHNATTGGSNQSSECNSRQNIKCDLLNENIYSNNLSANNAHAHKVQKTDLEEENHGTVNDSQKAVPFNKSLSYKGVRFSSFDLTELLYYNVNLMQDEQLFDYAFSLKCRILEKIYELKYPERDELEFLCALTDGTQTEKNQRLITARKCCIISHILQQVPETSDCPTTTHLLQPSDFSASSPPELSKFPVSSPPQISDFPASGPPQLSDFPASNPHQIPDFPASNLPQTSNSYNNNYESQVFEKVQNSDLPIRNDMEFNSLSEHNGQTNFSTDDVHKNNVIDSSVSNTVENVYVIKELFEHSCMPIVNSEANVPVNASLLTYEDSTFSIFGLDNLLNYDVDSMQGHSLLDYASAVKQRILENIHTFRNPIKEKLEFLCELTDGTQTEINQKLITARMCHLISDFNQMSHIPQNGRNSSSGYSRHANPRSHNIHIEGGSIKLKRR